MSLLHTSAVSHCIACTQNSCLYLQRHVRLDIKQNSRAKTKTFRERYALGYVYLSLHSKQNAIALHSEPGYGRWLWKFRLEPWSLWQLV
jgi:hypothetical protein